MARLLDFNQSTKATAASTTVTFTATDVPGDAVIAYLLDFTGAGMTAGDLTRIRIKAGGNQIWDVDFNHYAAWYERYSFSNRAPAAADTAMTLPLFLPGLRSEEDADRSQFPRGAAPSLELVIGAGGAVGTVTCHWVRTTTPAQFYPAFLGNVLNWSAVTNNNRYPLTEAGAIKAVAINTTGLTRGRLELAGVKRFEASGVGLIESQRFDTPATLSNPIVWDMAGPGLGGGQVATPGNSAVYGDVGAAWAGVANEVAVYAIRGQ